MIIYSRLLGFLILSLIFHLMIILILPELRIDFKNLKPREIELKIVKKSSVSKNIKSSNKLQNPIKEFDLNKIKEKLKRNKNQSKQVDSNVDIPVANNLEKVLIPEFENVQLEGEKSANKVELNSELAKTKEEVLKEYNQKNNEISASKNSAFYEIKKISNIRRKIIYEPPKPKFQLEKDTKITLKFKVDNYGIPYDIRFVTRSSSYVENIAINFIKRLRFDAVDYTKPDEVEIVLFFKVE